MNREMAEKSPAANQGESKIENEGIDQWFAVAGKHRRAIGKTLIDVELIRELESSKVPCTDYALVYRTVCRIRIKLTRDVRRANEIQKRPVTASWYQTNWS